MSVRGIDLIPVSRGGLIIPSTYDPIHQEESTKNECAVVIILFEDHIPRHIQLTSYKLLSKKLLLC
jgi:hypothetical protein